MFPKLWQGLETDSPMGMELTLEECFLSQLHLQGFSAFPL